MLVSGNRCRLGSGYGLPRKNREKSRMMNTENFQPVLLGTMIVFEEGDTPGMITDENASEVFIESDLFTGWTSKALFWELSGAE
jgi:hypothetical protein